VQVVGPDVCQQGSLVDFDRLRFDFNLSRAMTPEEVAQVRPAAQCSWSGARGERLAANRLPMLAVLLDRFMPAVLCAPNVKLRVYAQCPTASLGTPDQLPGHCPASWPLPSFLATAQPPIGPLANAVLLPIQPCHPASPPPPAPPVTAALPPLDSRCPAAPAPTSPLAPGGGVGQWVGGGVTPAGHTRDGAG
jgi:hypothetical protein